MSKMSMNTPDLLEWTGIISCEEGSGLNTVQDFLIKLGIKPRWHLLEIGIFSLYHVLVRPTKIMNRADKNWAHF